jgi:hypothetical protein
MLLGLLAGGLLLVPVFVTVGIHLGVENQKLIALIQGKPPPGQIANPSGSGGGYVPIVIETQQFCQKAYGFEPFPYRYLCKSFFRPSLSSQRMQDQDAGKGLLVRPPTHFPATLVTSLSPMDLDQHP